MRVFIDALGVSDVETGLSRYSLCLLAELIKDKSNLYCLLCSTNLPDNHEIFLLSQENVIFLRRNIPVLGPKRDLMYIALNKIIRRYDMYHCLASYLPLLGVPIVSVVTVHDLKYYKYPSFLKSKIKSFYLKLVLRITLEKSDYIIAISKSTKKDIYSIGTPKNAISVIYEANTITKEEVNNKAFLPLSLNKKEFYFFIGENRPHKNIYRLLVAYKQLLARHRENTPYLVVAGNGTDSKSLKNMVQELKIGNQVVLMGVVNENELILLFKNAIALVFPSLYEGFGLPILEAMYFRLAVITSNKTSTAEVAGNAALVCDPYDAGSISNAMEKVFTDHNLRADLVKKGREREREFSWEKTSQEVLRLYKTINNKGEEYQKHYMQ
jgi:glycosyltransferase involved in cell wall biosynthesis